MYILPIGWLYIWPTANWGNQKHLLINTQKITRKISAKISSISPKSLFFSWMIWVLVRSILKKVPDRARNRNLRASTWLKFRLWLAAWTVFHNKINVNSGDEQKTSKKKPYFQSWKKNAAKLCCFHSHPTPHPRVFFCFRWFLKSLLQKAGRGNVYWQRLALLGKIQPSLFLRTLGSLLICCCGYIRSQSVHSFFCFGTHHLHTNVITAITMQFHELGDIKLGFLQNLHLPNQASLCSKKCQHR